jgi:hypothetical protein
MSLTRRLALAATAALAATLATGTRSRACWCS